MRGRDRDQAMSDLVRGRGPALVRYARLFTSDPASAQDLVQDALVKVFLRTRGDFVPDTLEAYVRRTIATLSIDHHRRARSAVGRGHLVAAPGSDRGHAADIEGRVDLEAILRLLSPQERTVVVLRFYEDLTVPQVAQAMGLAGGTVKRYLSNALAKLEQHLGPIDPPDDRSVDVVGADTGREGRS